MEGAKFDGKLMAHVTASDATASPLKPCCFAWLRDTDANGQPTKAVFGALSLAVPVYMRRSRQKLLFELHVPVASAAMKEALILSGTACCLE
jgi:hypothetical protein